MFTKVNQFLNAPYPLRTSHKKGLINTLVISLFVACFLMVFQPFELDTIPGPYKLLIIASYGIPTFVVTLMVNQPFIYLARRYIPEEMWKIKHELGIFLLYPTLIGGANYAYGRLLFGNDPAVGSLLQMMINTAAVAFIPVLGWITFDALLANRANSEVAESIPKAATTASHEITHKTKKPHRVVLKGENKDESIEFDISEFLFAKAESNYVEVFVQKDSINQSSLLRIPMKAIEEKLSFSENVLRCHRSYIVNIDHVKAASGNAQGLILNIGQDQEIPVSRRYVPVLRNMIKG
jgi:hypothetical protein